MEEFDYIVIGAGSAGCVLAARLSEDPGVTVAVIESGGPDDAPQVHVPVAFSSLFKSALDWDLQTEPEPQLDGRRTYLPRGRMLGGSSSMNAMIYARGNRADYDDWAAGGADGWSYADVLPYFLRSEDNERGASEFHASGGPLAVSNSRSRHELSAAFIEAAVTNGIAANDDFNGALQDGVGFYQLTQRHGLRCSAAVAYLHPAMTRPNLTVLTWTTVLRVVIEHGRATGVRVARDGRAETSLRARREVILSAGTYETPKLLMLSGIGPAADLVAAGIPVVQDLPVGHGLQDHLLTVMNFRTDRRTLMSALSPENAELLERHGRGPLTSNVAEAGAFVRTASGVAPDTQLVVAPVLFLDEGLGAVTSDGLTIASSAVKPVSRGRVMLRSSDPRVKPRVQHNYLDCPDDVATQLRGVQFALRIAGEPALGKAITEPIVAPATDGDIEAFVRRHSQTFYHPTSTCAIGMVVDPELRVFGVDGLRVVDASVFPDVPRGNTNAPTIMAAEKGADLIRGR